MDDSNILAQGLRSIPGGKIQNVVDLTSSAFLVPGFCKCRLF